MTAMQANTVALPPLVVAGERLNIVCDLSRVQGIKELLAALTAWQELTDMDQAQVAALVDHGITGKDAWYALAMQRFRQALRRQCSPVHARTALNQLNNTFFTAHQYPQLRAALTQHFAPETFDGQPTQAPGHC